MGSTPRRRAMRTAGLVIAALGLAGCAPRFESDLPVPASPSAGMRGEGAPAVGVPDAGRTGELASAAATSDLMANRGALTPTAIIAEDGWRLALRSWLPRDAAGNPIQPRATIVAVHGFNDYSNAFTLPREALAPQGIAVFAHDQRGFRQTP